jgi:hypothetical protein
MLPTKAAEPDLAEARDSTATPPRIWWERLASLVCRVYALVKQYPGDRVLSENVGAVYAGLERWCATASLTSS